MSKLGLQQFSYVGKSPSDDSIYIDDVNNRVGIGTSSPGTSLQVVGSITTDGLLLGDNELLVLGTGSDLQISHNGTNSYITNTTGSLYLRTNADDSDVVIGTDDGAGGYQTYITCDGSSQKTFIYYDGSAVFETVSGGVDITGQLDATTLAINGTAITSTAAELNILDGVTATASELNILDGVTATASELNLLDGVTATTTELNYVDGVTSNIQTQLDAKAPTASPAFTGSTFSVQQNSGSLSSYFTGGTTAGDDSYLRVTIQNNTGTTALWFGDSDLSAPGRIQYEHNGDYMRFYTTNAEEMRLESDGDLHVDGDVIAYSTTISDERLKEDITLVDNALEKVNQLKGVTFKYKTDGKVSAGVIAQDVEKVLPEAVKDQEIPLKMDDGETYKTVRYDALHALLIEAIKELSAEVKLLKEGK